MLSLSRLSEFGFESNWRTLYIAWKGLPGTRRLLEREEVEQFAFARMQRTVGEETYRIVRLLDVLNAADDQAVEQELRSLAEIDGGTDDVEKDKWLVILVRDQLDSVVPERPLALADLTSFWITLGLPEDCPHIVQGRFNEIDPATYYTREMLDAVLKRHESWVRSKTDTIHENQKAGPSHP